MLSNLHFPSPCFIAGSGMESWWQKIYYARSVRVVIALLILIVASGGINLVTVDAPRPNLVPVQYLAHEGRRLSFYPHIRQENRIRPLVVLLPSLGRPVSDFNELAAQLHAQGYDTLGIAPRGMLDDSGLDDDAITLFDLADDVRLVLQSPRFRARPVVLVGHAFGNRLARAYATRYPQFVAGVVLLAAGGKVPLAPRARRALTGSFYLFLPDWWRARYVRYGFFAPDTTIPAHWMGGWVPRVAAVQARATQNTPWQDWWAGGGVPLLLIQGEHDTIAPPEHTADLLAAEFPTRLTLLRLANAGHALLPEQPDKIAVSVLSFLAVVSQ